MCCKTQEPRSGPGGPKNLVGLWEQLRPDRLESVNCCVRMTGKSQDLFWGFIRALQPPKGGDYDLEREVDPTTSRDSKFGSLNSTHPTSFFFFFFFCRTSGKLLLFCLIWESREDCAVTSGGPYPLTSFSSLKYSYRRLQDTPIPARALQSPPCLPPRRPQRPTRSSRDVPPSTFACKEKGAESSGEAFRPAL